MIGTTFRSTIAAFAVSLFAAAPCRADLFAYIAPQDQILRIDSASGNVTQTYDIPGYFPPASSTSGMAFDGRVLYLTSHLGSFDFLLQYDVTQDFWYPGPTLLLTVPNSTGGQETISGLGMVPDGFGGGNLIAVTRKLADSPASYIFQYQVIPGLFDPVFPDGNNPVGALPPAMDAQGADYDVATGELWISATELGAPAPNLRLLHTDVAGNVLQTLSPAVGPATLGRGLGFDNGAMFITGRDLPTSTNRVYEIDRTSGAVLRSFSLPGTFAPAALTGGTIIPEPGSFVLMAIGVTGLSLRRRR
jgi:hypothetical protein